ncbi:sugar porter family MFS transporter [Opitutales bacterium ASA1]|uniref:sugar porter family MFS transporter n=1 Tax=Congregicoccus parvus TaxID=3081749 RepID=UPI002B28CA97|nr:sugar porter family MFS transporter [Opitutales bacterium ASA1]
MSPRTYSAVLLFIAGMGGFLYGYDIGIIGAALLYLGKTVQLTAAQESLIVAAVLAGGTVSSVAAGAAAEWLGRKRLMIAAGVIFIASVAMMVLADDFGLLFAGRTLQGFSAGMIAVVIPLYLAECLPAAIRGRGTATFQLLLTTGILVAASVGAFYTGRVERSGIEDAAALLAAQDAAWRAMFTTAAYPGVLFLLGACVVSESPRWLMKRGLTERALAALRRARDETQAASEFAEMTAAQAATDAKQHVGGGDSLLQRHYVLPFLLACAVLALTQTTGINSILQFLVVILERSGLPAADAAARAAWVTAVNVGFTIVGLLLVDKLGRRPLLQIGSCGIALALGAAAATFFAVESGRLPATGGSGTIVSVCMMVFIASFAIGPGVCVWLALSELMPTRIRAIGMGIGLLINQGVSTAIAALFLPVVREHGYAVMFLFWAGCSTVFLLLATFVLPETKGRTLEQIEAGFRRRAR